MTHDLFRDKFYREVAERIRSTREEKGITRENLAADSYISTKFLYEVEVGRKGVSAYTLNCIAEALGVSVNYLVTGRGGTEDLIKELKETISKFEE